jgi:hypothetical protein
VKIATIILLIIAGIFTGLSFGLFLTPPSLAYLLHFFIAIAIFILGVVLFFINDGKLLILAWAVPVSTSLCLALVTIAMSNTDAVMIVGSIITGVGILAIIYTVRKVIISKSR